MKFLLEKIKGENLVKKHTILLLSLFTLCTFLVNTFHAEFPDEYDNILGGVYINNGLLPYKDFFSHHGPFSYFLASVITIISGNSFVIFRVLLSLVYFSFLILVYLLIKRRVTRNYSINFFIFAIILGLSGTYYWNQMLLADTLSGYLLIPLYAILILKTLYQSKIQNKDLIIISIFSSLTLFTSITYIYVVILIGLYTAYLYFFVDKNKILHKTSLTFLAIFLLPYLIFSGYLLITGSTSHFYEQAILYNKNTYIYNYPRPEGSTSLNPLRYAIVITYNFYQNYRALLTQVKDFNFTFPFNITLALINMALLIVLTLRKKYQLALFILLILIFTNPRSNPLTSKETDFQSAAYITLSLFNIPLCFMMLKESIDKNREYIYQLVYSSLFLIISIYTFFFLYYIGGKFFDRAYHKYMGLEPMIYNNPQVAPLINSLTSKEDYVWIGPLEFKEVLYLHAKNPGRYHWFLRAHSETPRINKDFIEDISMNRPKVIVYKKDSSEFGQSQSSINAQLVDILNKDYFQINDLIEEGAPYQVRFSSPDFSLVEHFYFRKDSKEELVNKLIESGTIST